VPSGRMVITVVPVLPPVDGVDGVVGVLDPPPPPPQLPAAAAATTRSARQMFGTCTSFLLKPETRVPATGDKAKQVPTGWQLNG
jgi:hypothetical protein